VDLKSKRLSAWVSARGDDEWFLVAEDVTLHTDVAAIDTAQVELSPDAPVIEGLQVRGRPDPELEEVRPHPLAKRDRVVDIERGFRFQSLRSTWRKSGKHVTVFRKPGVHAAFVDVALASPRHLIAVWRNGSHTSGSSGISVAHSHDLGRTWDEPVLVASDGTLNCPRIQRLKNGTLIVLSDGGGSIDRVGVWRSADEGKTWDVLNTFSPKSAGGSNEVLRTRSVSGIERRLMASVDFLLRLDSGPGQGY